MKIAKRSDRLEAWFNDRVKNWTLQNKVIKKCRSHLYKFTDRLYSHYLDVMKQFHCVSIQCGAGHTLVLAQSGVVWSGGYEEDGQLGHGTLLDQLKYIYSAQSEKEDAEKAIAELLSVDVEKKENDL